MPDLLPLSLRRRRPGRIRPELDSVREALRLLGDPQRAFSSVLVVGTNGKGSTAAMLTSVLQSHGLRVGLTTSPHLTAVEERIRIDGKDISRRELERHLTELESFPDLTFFETLTAAAFLAFAEAGVQTAVLEAGMGGSWDATRLAESAVAGITNIGTDHLAWLGATAEERACDKGAALRNAELAVVGSGMTRELVPFLNAPDAVDADALVELSTTKAGRFRARWNGAECLVDPPLAGVHQIANLHLALALARAAADTGMAPPLDVDAVARGLAGVRWPGRLSRVRFDGRDILVDGAHNREGAEALAAHLGTLSDRYNLLFSCLDDKPVDAMARALRTVVADVALVELIDDRAMPISRMSAAFPSAVRYDSVEAALRRLADPVAAAGSLRLVGQLMDLAEEGDAG